MSGPHPHEPRNPFDLRSHIISAEQHRAADLQHRIAQQALANQFNETKINQNSEYIDVKATPVNDTKNLTDDKYWKENEKNAYDRKGK